MRSGGEGSPARGSEARAYVAAEAGGLADARDLVDVRDKKGCSVRRRIGLVLCAVGVCLVLAAAGLFLYNTWLDYQGGAQAAAVLEGFKGRLSASEDAVSGSDGSMPTFEVDGNRYIGYLTIPDLGLELPVMESWSLDFLSIAPCRYTGSYKTGDLVICAHNYSSHFGRLDQLDQGASVYLTDAVGAVHGYQVVSGEVLQPTAIEDMVVSDYDLTLFTCTYGGRTRFTLRCKAV